MPKGLLKAIAKAKNPSTSPDELRELSTYPALAVKVAVSLNPNIPEDIRQQLEVVLGPLNQYKAFSIAEGK